jgi:hypothetical protein
MLTDIRKWFLPEEKKEQRDIKIIPILDLHSGGSTALFPYYNGDDLGIPPHRGMTGDNGGWRFSQSLYTPSAKQYQLFKHFTHCAEKIAQERKEGQRFIVVGVGDSIDGIHHDTLQLTTRRVSEQNSVHIWLMKYFMAKIGFDKNKGDLLYIGVGTEIHSGDEENNIAQDLDAEILPNGNDTFDFMPMDVNGKRFWFLHQGASAGRDLTLGNALHNWMKSKYFSCLEDKRVPFDCVISGHYHKNVYDTFTRKDVTRHGIILPSWQLKTRFGYRVAAAEMEEIGIRTIDVSADGEIKVNSPILMKVSDEVVTI